MVRCVSCSLVRLLVDPKVEGDFTVHLTLTIRTDGTPDSVVIKDAPSEAIRAKLQEQMTSWLFEPPMKDDTPVAVRLNESVTIHVFRPR
jgi:outer membrane biosynthesis protein TonB